MSAPTEIDDGGPVHPIFETLDDVAKPGMSKREHYAGLVMAKLLGSENYTIKGAAEVSVAAADALIAELKK